MFVHLTPRIPAVRLLDGRIAVERPGGRAPAKKPTKADMLVRRNELRAKLARIRVGREKGSALAFGISFDDEAALEREIDIIDSAVLGV